MLQPLLSLFDVDMMYAHPLTRPLLLVFCRSIICLLYQEFFECFL